MVEKLCRSPAVSTSDSNSGPSLVRLTCSTAQTAIVGAPLIITSPSVPISDEPNCITVICPKPNGDTPMSRIPQLAATYSLTSGEVERLNAVLGYYAEDEVNEELLEELKCIMGDRKLAYVRMLSPETVRLARRAVEEGYTGLVPQEMAD